MYPFQMPLFENYNPKVLVIVDIQEGFSKFFPCDYLKKIHLFAKQFKTVYQIWDETDAESPSYKFENQVDTIVKTYGGDVDEYDIKNMTTESQERFNVDHKVEDYSEKYGFNDGGALFFIGMGKGEDPGHMWFRVSKEYMDFLEELKRINADVILVGGGKWECIYDVEITLLRSGITYNYNDELVFDATSGCTNNNCNLNKELQ